MKDFILAIDGGGTSTCAVLFEHTGKVIWKADGAHSNPNACTDLFLHNEFQKLLEPAAESMGQSPVNARLRIFAGIAGCSHHASQLRLRSILGSIFPNASDITVTHDGINALFRGTHGRPGIVVISGTGSLVMARDEKDEEHRVGGWGYLLGDEGSGYDIGRRALKAALDEYDGTGQSTVLTNAVLSFLHVGSPPDIISLIYGEGRSLIASLAPLVMESAFSGDAVALEIANASAATLAKQLDSMLMAMREVCPRPVPVILSGGVWRSAIMVQAFISACSDARDVNWIMPGMPPVYGAAVQAMTRQGILPTFKFALNFAVTYGLNYRPDKGEWS